MAGEINSPYMGLPVPTVGLTTGPQWASDLNVCLSLIDSHNHSPGQGLPITPDGLNISSDLTFNNNNATNARSYQMFPQSAALSLSTDLTCLYTVNADLYYNDGNGTQIRITEAGAVVGPAGSITNLNPPASAAYVAGTGTFVWQSNVNTPAYMDCASVLIRNFSASSFALTLQAPSLGTNYTLTLPTVPASTKIMTVNSSGQMGSVYDVDNSTIAVTSNLIGIKAASITQTQLSNNINLPGDRCSANGYSLCVSGTASPNLIIKIIGGEFDGSGNIQYGGGYTVSHTGQGVYVINFSVTFQAGPAVVANAKDNNPDALDSICSIWNISTSSVTIKVNKANSGQIDCPVAFIAYGTMA